MHRDARFYPEPARFLPERWLDLGREAMPAGHQLTLAPLATLRIEGGLPARIRRSIA